MITEKDLLNNRFTLSAENKRTYYPRISNPFTIFVKEFEHEEDLITENPLTVEIVYKEDEETVQRIGIVGARSIKEMHLESMESLFNIMKCSYDIEL